MGSGYTHFKNLAADKIAIGQDGAEVVVIGGAYNGSATWDPASIADGDMESVNITVTGAALGDFVLVSLGTDTLDLTLTAQVTAANVVTATLANNTGAGVDLTSSTVYARVFTRT
jgi:hypothetical protein